MIYSTRRSKKEIAAFKQAQKINDALCTIKDPMERLAAFNKIYGSDQEFARKHRRYINRVDREMTQIKF